MYNFLVSFFMLFIVPMNLNAKEHIISLKLGDTKVDVLIYENTVKKSGYTYFHPHQDEVTSKEVTKKIIDKYGGRLISLEHSSLPERNIDFTWKVNNYSLDPNRMFSKVGIQKSLDVKDKEIAEMVYSFAMKVAEIITVPITNNIVIAVHNNYNKGYSVDSYRPDHDSADDAADLYINPERSSGEFFYVTERGNFSIIKDYGYNVVLQNERTVEDDGSFSVYAQSQHLNYINVEAERGNYNEQLDMIEFSIKRVLTKLDW